MRLNTRAKIEEEIPPWLTSPRQFRWAIVCDRWAAGIHEEVLIPGYTWMHAIRYFVVGFNNHWSFGAQHMYYDGPHCSWSLGYLHFAWSTGRCSKCMPED